MYALRNISRLSRSAAAIQTAPKAFNAAFLKGINNATMQDKSYPQYQLATWITMICTRLLEVLQPYRPVLIRVHRDMIYFDSVDRGSGLGGFLDRIRKSTNPIRSDLSPGTRIHSGTGA
ncbi:hypothetical protein BGZ79_008614 [Entomortierella chlamydospora]|nr:hypothetical protein BGZ79_008614 [Entomortierella chlamydospora]